MSLPKRTDTDGELLQLQAQHTLPFFDNNTSPPRVGGGVWPRYGTFPGYDQGADGFQEIFTSTIMASLEWGLYGHAHDVLDNFNFLTYFIRSSGAVLYRGLEMTQHSRMLTSIVQ